MSQQSAAVTIQRAVKQAVAAQGRKQAGRMGKALGRATGVPGLSRIGKQTGRTVGATLARLVGSGDYATNAVSTNSLFGGGSSMGSFGSATNGMRFAHREFVMDMTTGPLAGRFVNQSFSINPGNQTLCPMLAAIASNFEEYKVHGLVFQFVSSTSPYLAAGALGTYVMTMEYNASAPDFSSKTQAENSDYALSERLDKSAMYGVECAPSQLTQPFYYVSAPGTTTPVNLTDIGKFQFCLAPGATVPVSSVIGELWMAYDIEFTRPRLGLTRSGYFHTTRTTAVNATPNGTASTWEKSFGSLTGVTITDRAITFPDARLGDIYRIDHSWNGTAPLGAVVLPSRVSTNLTGYLTYLNGTVASNSGGVGVLSTNVTQSLMYIVDNVTYGTPPALTLGIIGILPIGAPTVDITITHIGNGFATGSL